MKNLRKDKFQPLAFCSVKLSGFEKNVKQSGSFFIFFEIRPEFNHLKARGKSLSVTDSANAFSTNRVSIVFYKTGKIHNLQFADCFWSEFRKCHKLVGDHFISE